MLLVHVSAGISSKGTSSKDANEIERDDCVIQRCVCGLDLCDSRAVCHGQSRKRSCLNGGGEGARGGCCACSERGFEI